MQEHLEADALERLVHRTCHVSRAYGWLLHLLACPPCRNRLVEDYPRRGRRLLEELFDTQSPLELPDLEDPAKLDRVLEHLRTHSLALYEPGAGASLPLDELTGHPPQRQQLIVANSRRFHHPEVAEAFLQRCEFLWHHEAHRAIESARLALTVLERLDPRVYHPKALADLRGLAWTFLGNSYRVASRKSEALACMHRAVLALEEGSGDPLEQARLLDRWSSLERDLEHIDKALQYSRRAADLFKRHGEMSSHWRARVTTLSILGFADRGQEVIEAAEILLDELPEEEEFLRMLVEQNLAGCLGMAGWTLPALRRMGQIRPWMEENLGLLAHWRLDWREAQVLIRAGDLDTGAEGLAHCLGHFEEAGLGGDAVMLRAELAEARVRQGRRRDGLREARKALLDARKLGSRRVETQAREILKSA